MIFSVIADHSQDISYPIYIFGMHKLNRLDGEKEKRKTDGILFGGLFSSLRETTSEGRQTKVAAPLRVVRATRRGREAGKGGRDEEKGAEEEWK